MKSKNIYKIFLLSTGILVMAVSCPGIKDELWSLPDFPGMGIGINIGNTLDSIGNFSWTAGETGWGNPKITQDFIKALKAHGYKTIRLPVTWAENIGAAPNYTITTTWMNRVEEVVGWIVGEDMNCILNLHHDGGTSDRSWILGFENNEDVIGDMFVKVWQQIAGRFKDYSDKLVLESMNEVGFNTGAQAERYRKMNKLNQLFVDTVRSSGSRNAERYLLIAGFWTDIDQTVNSLFQMPQDTIADKLIISVHYYTPSTFCIAETPDNSWGFKADWGNSATAAADTAELERQFNKLKTRFIDSNIPVIVGEYGVVKNQNKVEEGRIRWMAAVTQACLDYGMCPVLWDTGGEISRYSPFEMSVSLRSVYDSLELPEP